MCNMCFMHYLISTISLIIFPFWCRTLIKIHLQDKVEVGSVGEEKVEEEGREGEEGILPMRLLLKCVQLVV